MLRNISQVEIYCQLCEAYGEHTMSVTIYRDECNFLMNDVKIYTKIMERANVFDK